MAAEEEATSPMRAVVVAHGDPDPRDVAHLSAADLVVAADGGALWLEEVGVRPHRLVGDLDSLDASLVDRLAASGTRVDRHPAEKDESDTELAMRCALDAGADEIVLLAALSGERLDHELANVLLLADPMLRGRDVRIVRGGTTVRALHGGDRLQLGGRVGDLVTLLSLHGDATGVHTTGLRYPLRGEALRLGASRGVSNEVAEPPAAVEVERGTLLVVEVMKEGSIG
jgi:thiamine pyrophosphokinase